MFKGYLYILWLTFSVVISTGCSHKKEDTGTDLFRETYRPQFHLTKKEGFFIDPTATVWLNGRYHVNKRLATSADLLRWELEENKRIRNDSVREMSGGAVIDWNNTSGFGENGSAPYVSIYSELRLSDGSQYQCLAYSNDEGNTWTIYDGNPIIDIGSREFRDPQVFWHEESQKWIMVITLSEHRKVSIYNSDNLKEWNLQSNFGPIGADGGVWECPDLFPLAVDGDSSKIKWVMEVDVQPVGGQYFIGEFDGKEFVADPEFIESIPKLNSVPEGYVLFDFENDLSEWTMVGEAFKSSPSRGKLPNQNAVLGYEGELLINSFHNQDGAKGRINSPEFSISKNYINFLIGGGMHPSKTCMNLYVDGVLVRTQTGLNTETMTWASWDVSEFIGKNATLEIVDDHSGGFGHINIDHVMLANEPAISIMEPAFWIDYGPDFYAVRSWVNGPPGDNRKIWVAWMGNWLYAREVPTDPWIGMHSFPRSLELKNTESGTRLFQQPIDEIKELRKELIVVSGLQIENRIELEQFKPTRNVYEMEVVLIPENDTDFGLLVAKGGTNFTKIGYDSKLEQLYVDRSKSGDVDFHPSFPLRYTAPLKMTDGRLKLRLLVDQSSVEVFANDGAVTITAQIFPGPDDLGIEFFSVDGETRIDSLTMWELESIWFD